MATYYCYGDNRRITANGEVFNPHSMTCAYYVDPHNKREFLNKYVRVCGLYCVDLKISDNGEFRDSSYKHLGHVIDLTPAAFKAVGGSKQQGVIPVTIFK